MKQRPDKAPKLTQHVSAEARRYARKCGLSPQEAERMLKRAERKLSGAGGDRQGSRPGQATTP